MVSAGFFLMIYVDCYFYGFYMEPSELIKYKCDPTHVVPEEPCDPYFGDDYSSLAPDPPTFLQRLPSEIVRLVHIVRCTLYTQLFLPAVRTVIKRVKVLLIPLVNNLCRFRIIECSPVPTCHGVQVWW